ncbi:Anaphase-promoting complex subunit 1 [Schistosoma japonicum]|nr:Anaphase-promoting complex subunit 1 [Schistosoma japonicum]
MSDTMILAKAVIDVVPSGRQYLSEFCWRDNVLDESSIPLNGQPHVNENIPGRIQDGLSVFESERMTFIDDCGEHYTVRVPCRIGEVWALNTLVLLQRQPSSCEVIIDSRDTASTGQCALFSLFSLTHPLDEAAPVILKVPLSSGGFGIGFVTDVHLRIIGVIESLNLVITYHSLTKLHSVWQLEKASAHDYIYLYQMDADGCASVATHALTGLVYQSESSKHVENLSEDQTALDGHSTGCSTNPIISLSPFAASLSRLTRNETQSRLNHSGDLQSSGHSLVAPFTPTDLNNYISRLSNVTPCNNLGYLPPIVSSSSNFPRRPSISHTQPIGNTCTPKPISNIQTPKHNTVNLNALHGRLSSTRRNLCSNQFGTPVQTEKLYTIYPDQVENLLDEPLLPKVCLRLVWSEPPSPRPFSALNTTSPLSPGNYGCNHKKKNVGSFVPYAPDLSASGRFALLNRRLPDLLFPTSKTESVSFNSPITIKNKTLDGNLCNSYLTVTKDNDVILPQHRSGPMKTSAFVSTDLISASWICFLTGSSGLDARQSRLACLRLNDKYLDCKQLDNIMTVFGDLVYLRACDAVYVCLLGLSPPPLLSTYLSVGGPQIVKSRLKYAASDIEVPFIVRHDLLNTERWHRNTVHSILSKCTSILASDSVLGDHLYAASCESDSNKISFCFSELPSDFYICLQLVNIKELYTKQGNNHLRQMDSSVDTKNYSEMHASNKRPEIKSVERISLCDPAGNAFTIVNEGKASSIDKERDSLNSGQFLRVYLPMITENELVQRCLTSLNHCLPEDASLLLFTRWYVISNVPGTKSSCKFQGSDASSYDDTDDLGAYNFNGPAEWNRFANFILSASDLGSIFQSSKRHRPSNEESSESDWNNLISLLDSGCDNELIQPSLFLQKSTNFSSAKIDFNKKTDHSYQKQILYVSYIRDDPNSRVILSYLPTVLFSFHLTYEEAKLNSVLQDQLRYLAELNFIISSILNLPAYTTFYETEYSSLCNVSLITHANLPVEWPDKISFDTAPCLLTWITRQLESVYPSGTSVKLNPYPYLTGVNDLSIALAGVIISALSTEKLNMLRGTDSKLAVQHLLEFWSDQIFTWKTPRKSSGSVWEYQPKKTDDFPVFNDAEVQQLLQNAGPYACSYVETLLTSVRLSSSKLPRETDSPCLPISAQHLALLFLSRLESSSTMFYGVLSRRLRLLPSGLSMILRIFLSRCRLHPPPNCDPHVYSLMDSSCARVLCIFKFSIYLNVYHFFQDDLRLREAYRLLQSFSHIRLPRLNSEDPTNTSPNNASGSDLNARLTEARFEMHLAAAGIRVWASVIGRGMLTFGILTGSKVPTQLRVPPICLRGRAISPSSGRRVLVDLAREPLGSTNVNVGANRTPGATEGIAGGLDIAGNGGDRLGTTGVQGADASNHPGNSMALAIASSIASCGAGASLRTVSLGLKRMIPRNNLLNNYASSNISTTATNSASSAASLLSTANIQQAPGVLAAKHWPDFHNGVAIGLSISPHASIDATWIMYNCRAAGLSSANNRRNNSRTNQDSASSLDISSPEQAGLLLGLGLNGHLNKITPYDIGEYLVRVHDLHNMAVLLGLCAGRRGTMDQSVLRLIAVHYRPLLPSDPLINVQLSVPNLCQAAAIFGLGLLYQGSAHRHITNLLINELGRSLSDDSHSSTSHLGINADTNSQQTASNASNNHPTNSTVGWTGAGGSGGFAGDSCELMALSAGLALGLVLLQRGDTPCGLSDLHWAEKLHAYMTSGPKSANSSVPDNQQYNVHFPCDSQERFLPFQPAKCRGASRRLSDQSRRPTQTSVETTTSNTQNNLSDPTTRGGASFPLSTFRTPSLLLHTDYSSEPLIDPERFLTNDHLHNSMEIRGISSYIRQSSSRRRASSNTGPSLSPSVTSAPNRFSSTISDLAGRLDEYSTKTTWKNPQIRDLHCYNADVSAPGAMMALGMAYLGSGNSTVSNWLLPPTSLRQLELIRPDLLLFQALAYSLVNWNSIEPTQEWIDSYIPEQLFEKLLESIKPRPKLHTPDISDIRVELGQIDLSSEDDVENRCPDQTFIDTLYHASGRTIHNRGRRGTLNNIRGRSFRRSRRYDIEQWSEEESAVNNIKPVIGKSEWFDQFGLQSIESVDIEAISLAYLNMLVGRALAMGLRYAGTSNSAAANTLYYLTKSILDETWWPPSYFICRSPCDSEQINASLPKSTLVQSAAQCLLALAMILAGSGNLTVLKMVRHLRSIRLFSAKPDTMNSAPNNNIVSDSLYHTVTAAAARAAANTQTVSTSSSVGGPVSVASVFGAALGPSYGLQMLLANTIGLLFLGGGRLTLANTPEAAAMLVISFFPLLPTFAGDNWYYLQALRHLYALATIPRRVCAVDIDTGQVALSNFEAKLKESDVILSSNDTFVFPSDVLDNISWLEINHNSDKYWPTVFYHGTNNWDLFNFSFDVLARFWELAPIHILDECLKQWLDFCILKQLKLLVAFLKRFPSQDKLVLSNGDAYIGNKSSSMSSRFDLGRVIAARVTQHFIKHKDELSVGLKNYYFDLSKVTSAVNQYDTFQSKLVKAFRLWFSLPDYTVLLPHLPKDDAIPFANFISIVKQHCSTTPIQNMLWLYRFLYSHG